MLDTVFYLLQVADEGVFVIFPVAFESLFRWELLTTQLHGDLEAVAAQVIEVLHSCPSTKGESVSMSIQWLQVYTGPSDNLRPPIKGWPVSAPKDPVGVYTQQWPPLGNRKHS